MSYGDPPDPPETDLPTWVVDEESHARWLSGENAPAPRPQLAPCETCGGPAGDEEAADLYARLEAAEKALAVEAIALAVVCHDLELDGNGPDYYRDIARERLKAKGGET